MLRELGPPREVRHPHIAGTPGRLDVRPGRVWLDGRPLEDGHHTLLRRHAGSAIVLVDGRWRHDVAVYTLTRVVVRGPDVICTELPADEPVTSQTWARWTLGEPAPRLVAP